MRQFRSGGVSVSLNTPPVLRWHTLRKYQVGGSRVSPGVRARLGPTIASAIAQTHAHVLRLIVCKYEVRAANERRWCIYGLNITGGLSIKHTVLNTPPVVYF